MSRKSKIQNPKSKIQYRSRQFFRALLGRMTAEELEEAQRVLGPGLYPMFERIPGQYSLHMLEVYRRVREAGCEDQHVWQAALLHDAGKYDPDSGRYVSIPYRVAIVLLKVTLWGRAALRGLSEPPRSGEIARHMGWRYPFYLSRHHAEMGARRAAAYGASREVVELIARHHDHGSPGAALAALRAADERS